MSNEKDSVAELTQSLIQGGWSSVYAFVAKYATEDDFYNDDDDEEEDDDEEV